MKIHDSHSHWLPKEIVESASFFHPDWSDIDTQIKAMDQAQVEKALLTYPTTDAHLNIDGGWNGVARIFNDGISGLVRKHSDRFIGAFILPFGEPDSMYKECKRAYKELGLKVISLASSYNSAYLDDEMFFGVYDFCQKKNIPVFIHSQIIEPIGSERINDPLLSPVIEYVFDLTMCAGKLMMSGIFTKFPDLKFVFAHFAGVLPFIKERFDATYNMLRGINFVKDLGKNPSEILSKIYLDTSGCKSISALQCALETTDSAHILFGSDWPANRNLSGSIEIIGNSGLGKEDKEKILYKNLNRILGG